MGQCDYWLSADSNEWCELTSSGCGCGGSEESCSLSGKTIKAALQEEEKITLLEIEYREKRRRASDKRAS